MSRSTTTLWGLRVSPWTEKARWALDHHAIAYRYREHTPLLGEPALRWRARGRAPGTRATVPLLVDGSERILDSGAIVRHVDRRGENEPLIPSEYATAIEDWEAASEAALHAARVLLANASLASPDALVEQLPPQIPGPLRRPLLPLARSGMQFIARKHDAGPDAVAASTSALTQFAERLRGALGSADHLVGNRLTAGDIAAAMVVNGFAGGVPGRFVRMPATGQTWTRPALIEAFGDLVAWRDRLYAQHRSATAQVR